MGKAVVAYLGPVGTFSEQATLKLFSPKDYALKPHKTIPDIFAAVAENTAHYGVVPVENSVEGSVNATLDQLYRRTVHICGEVELEIQHHLIGNPDSSIQRINTVVSHSHALAQCRDFLTRKLPNARIIEADSTALAVQKVKRHNMRAAIGTTRAAETAGMKILAKNIGDLKENVTRFIVIGEKESPPTGSDKTSILFSAPNVPGALYKALEPFAKRNINLSRIESRPTRKAPWQYVFFLDFENHISAPPCRDAVAELEQLCPFLRVLGSYPKAQ